MTSISVVGYSITCFQCLVIWTLRWFGWGCAVYLFRVLMVLGCILGGRPLTSYQILCTMLLKLHTESIAHTLIHLVKMKCTWRRRWKMKLAVYFFKSSNVYPAWTQNGLRSVLSASCDKALEFFFIPVQRATNGTRFNLATCNFMNDVIITSCCLCLKNREMLNLWYW